MKRLFGTDGIRGVAGEFPLDPPTVAATGAALVRHLISTAPGARAAGGGSAPPRILVGRDTRESGPWMQESLIAGVRRAGGIADPIGVITTPGLAYLTGRGEYQAGVMLSASHNPFADNGIKIFAPDQLKLSDESERALEEEILKEITEIAARGARSAYEPPEVRAISREKPVDGYSPSPSAEERAIAERLLDLYQSFLVESTAQGLSLGGLRLVLDCANGSASAIAPSLFASLGAEVIATHASPDGRNINEICGALHPEVLGRAVVEARGDLGLAFDGDADRCLLVDRRGRLLDGDFILYLEARRLRARGALPGSAVVATVMSNLWLEKKLGEEGVRLLRTPVGDKYVLDRMLSEGVVLGGEQSGHVIFLDRCRTGDGILTGLRISEAVVQDSLDLERLADGIQRYPQIIMNVPVSSKPPLDTHPEIGPVIREVESTMAGDGRVLVRYSGTERLARVMVEGSDAARTQAAASRIADAIRKSLGAA